ncbi:amphiphysin-like isoform X3 [Sinocyclocheilus anshuiensis]|uniref:amphiphysin-like isoform X3 n=1 Tax=Sinocyclocheilus anshuiensis TaxID=1608454 RepID=UPI0007BA339C|nr:PREDICTED: amphiphysin-like isoform X3 [Sinocyclocheilus anshuiensis]
MAEIKTGIFAKNVQKRLSRAQEKVLQKLGKADETKDEQFEQCVQNFKRQEFEGSRLQREMKAYIAAVKGMQQASRNLTESLHEVYESDWHGKDDVMIIGKNCDVLWEDFHQKLVDSTINTLETYLTQFPDLKIRVAKRSRKLIDYDSARHHLETLQASTMRNEKKIAKAEEDLKKAQRVFDDLNVGLQDELPTLWDSRVGFYVSTFQNVSSLEARFHREISFLCHKLYEVMNKLAEQHSDKMFTIQGAPRVKRDSGPLRLARTPTPPDDESSDSSPAASPNHTLRPTSPGPPRPKSPSQLKMGPPKPPPPKATPTKELQQEQIIDLFDGGFPEISVTSPQPNEKPGESLLDLDFDPFKPDASTPIGQTQSPISQTLPWDLWAGNAAQPAQPAADAGFTANWAADFGSSATTGTEESGNAQPAVDEQGWPPAEGWPTEAASQPQEEAATDEVRAWNPENYPEPDPDCDPCAVGGGEAKQQHPGQGKGSVEEGQTDWAKNQVEWAKEKASCRSEERDAEETVGLQPMPGIIFTDEFGQEIQDTTEGVGGDSSRWGLSSQVDLDGSSSEYETAEEWGDVPGQNGGWVSADDELECAENENPVVSPEQGTVAQECFADWGMSDGVPEQITPADSGFGGDAFAANWDQPEATPCVSELENESLDEPISDPAKAGANMPQNVLESTPSSDPFDTEGNDPFGTGDDLFAASGDDPFGNGNDPFATSDQDPVGFSESDPFVTTGSDLFDTEGLSTESPKSGFPSDQRQAEIQPGDEGQWAADPFATEFTSDPFATGGNQDPFANEITSDPFANESGRDPFTSENNQGWAGGWESTGTKEIIGQGKDSDVFDDKTGHANGFAQWAAFPAPAADSENSSKGSWQEVSDSSGFFSSDGQGNFTAGWPGEDVPSQDPFTSFPVQQDTSNLKSTIAEDKVCHKEPENSDLSEDEVANRRYGKLYQEIDTELEEVSNKAFNGFSKDATVPTFVAEFDKMSEVEAPEGDVAEGEGEAAPASVPEGGEGPVTTPPTDTQPAEITASSPPAETATSAVESPVSAETEAAEQAELPVEDIEKEQPSEEAPATVEDKESPIEETPTIDAKPEEEASSLEAKPGDEPDNVEPKPTDEPDKVDTQPGEVPDNIEPEPGDAPDNVEPQPGDETSKEGAANNGKEEEKMPIPSVVIEPASSNEGDDDRDGDIISPIATSDNGVITECQTTKDISSGMPPGYLFRVEMMHDFEAANPDELELKKGDIVLVVPTELAEDQDAGWLTGIRESDWLQHGTSAQKGLFPENFMQRLE